LIFREKHKAIEVVAAGDKLGHIRDLHHLICGTISILLLKKKNLISITLHDGTKAKKTSL